MGRICILFLLITFLTISNTNAQQKTADQYLYTSNNPFLKHFKAYKSQINQKFIILPYVSSYKKYAYESCANHKVRFKRRRITSFKGQDSKLYQYYPYKKLVGKTVVLKDAKLTNDSNFGDIDFCSEYYLPEAKQTVYLPGSCSRNSLNKTWECSGHKVLNIKNFDNIKNKYKDKALFLRSKTDLYMDLKKKLSSTIKLKKYSPVYLLNVFIGNHTDPIAIQVSSNKSTGFLFVKNEAEIEKLFYSTNPKEMYKWSDVSWKKINEEKLWLGMTKNQAVMSWGRPDDVNKYFGRFLNHEQWMYGNSYLYFENDKLTSWRN